MANLLLILGSILLIAGSFSVDCKLAKRSKNDKEELVNLLKKVFNKRNDFDWLNWGNGYQEDAYNTGNQGFDFQDTWSSIWNQFDFENADSYDSGNQWPSWNSWSSYGMDDSWSFGGSSHDNQWPSWNSGSSHGTDDSWNFDWSSWSSFWDEFDWQSDGGDNNGGSSHHDQWSSWNSWSSDGTDDSWNFDWSSWSSFWDESDWHSDGGDNNGGDSDGGDNNGGDNDGSDNNGGDNNGDGNGDENCIEVTRNVPDAVKTGTVLPTECGVKHVGKRRPTSSNSRIVGGKDIYPNEWPWLVALAGKYGQDYQQFCGGTLIAPGWVLTAAHCVSSFEGRCPEKDELVIIAGEHDLANPSDHEEILSVKRVIIHRDYSDVTNDIALIELGEDASTEKDQLGVACLPKFSATKYSDSICYVAGWGVTETGALVSPSIAQHVEVKMVDQTSCNNDYKGAIVDGMICAGGNGVDSCQGDSGGPLTCVNNGIWTLVGVVSWGVECAVNPGVYADSYYYNDWIMKVLKAKFE